MATTDIVFTGFYYAVGATVSVSIAGLDCGDYVVSALGTVTVPINSDKNQLCNGANLLQYDVGPYDNVSYGDATTSVTLADGSGGIATIYLPVVIGFVYPAVGGLLRRVDAQDIQSPRGPGIGKTRRTHWISALLLNTQGIAFGSPSGIFDTAPLDDGAGNVLPLNSLFSGVWSKPIDDNPGFDSLIGWQVVRPFPCTVVSISGALETSER